MIQEKRKKRERTPSRPINFIATNKSKVHKFIKLWNNYTDFIFMSTIGSPQKWNDEFNFFEMIYIKELEQDIIPRTKRYPKNPCLQPFNLIAVHQNGKLGLCCNDNSCSLDFGNYKNLEKSFFENENLNKIREGLKNNKLFLCKDRSCNHNLSKDYISQYLPELATVNNKKMLYNNKL